MPLLQRTAPIKAGREQTELPCSPPLLAWPQALQSHFSPFPPVPFPPVKQNSLLLLMCALCFPTPGPLPPLMVLPGVPFPPVLQGPLPPLAWPGFPAGTGLPLLQLCLMSLRDGLLGEPALTGTEHLEHSIATQLFVRPSTVPSVVPRVL